MTKSIGFAPNVRSGGYVRRDNRKEAQGYDTKSEEENNDTFTVSFNAGEGRVLDGK